MVAFGLTQLVQTLEDNLQSFGASYRIDGDGDFSLEREGFNVLITPVDFGDGHTLAKVWTVVAGGIGFSESLMEYLNLLNRRYTFGTFYWANNLIYIHQTLSGSSLGVEELRWTIETVATIADEVEPELENRFGGSGFDWSSSSTVYYKPWTREEYEAPASYSLGTVLVAGAVGVAAGVALGYALSDSDGGGGGGGFGREVAALKREHELLDREAELDAREADLEEEEMAREEEEWEEEMAAAEEEEADLEEEEAAAEEEEADLEEEEAAAEEEEWEDEESESEDDDDEDSDDEDSDDEDSDDEDYDDYED